MLHFFLVSCFVFDVLRSFCLFSDHAIEPSALVPPKDDDRDWGIGSRALIV
jgi:hypothetical protein